MKRSALLFWAACGLVWMDCSRSVVVRKFYVLEPQQTTVPAALQLDHPMPIKVDVRDFTIAKAFDQTRIALRTQSNELNYYYYHLWAVRPASAVADMVYQIVSPLNLFQRCTRGFSIGPDYYLSGQIMALERTQMAKKEYAHVSGTLFLFDARTELPVLQQDFNRLVDLKKTRSMNGFAHAAGTILQGEMETFLQQIVEFYHAEQP